MKRGVIFFWILVILASWSSGQATAIGISPVTIDLSYAPGETAGIEVTVLNFADHPINATLGFGGPSGHLVKHKDKVFLIDSHSSKKVMATIVFPPDIEPGGHLINMAAMELPLGGESGISVFGSISGEIRFFVPYPGTYARISLSGSDVNVNEELALMLMTSNLGRRPINNVVTTVTMADGEGTEKWRTVNVVPHIAPGDQHTNAIPVSTQAFDPGDYVVRAVGKYNAIATNEEEIYVRLGHLFVNITGVAIMPFSGGIYKAVISTESRWNGVLENVYAVLEVYDSKQSLVKSLQTPSVGMSPWEKGVISAFWEAPELKPGKYMAKVTLHYQGKTAIKEVPFEIARERDVTYLAVRMVILLAVIIVIDYFWLRRKKKREIGHE